ncbi:iron-containing alcohol dehydrogenase, partial [Desulfobulbus sp. F4]|nr:iron-containing alcohol dehydrogenase [Desulfobulbus sp. F4]
VIPAWLRGHLANNPARIARFGQRVFGVEQDAEQAIKALRSWFSKVGCPVTLAELNIPACDIPKIAENALALAQAWQMHDYTKAHIEAILRLCC